MNGFYELVNDAINKHISDGQYIFVTKLDNKDDNILYYTQNNIGSTTLLTNKEGNDIGQFLYTPFGEMWVEEASEVDISHITRFFTNQQYDKESGLYYYNARYYDPHLGSFITPDPAMDSLNHYAYCNSNPINYTDPTGLVGGYEPGNSSTYDISGDGYVDDPEGIKAQNENLESAMAEMDRTRVTNPYYDVPRSDPYTPNNTPPVNNVGNNTPTDNNYRPRETNLPEDKGDKRTDKYGIYSVSDGRVWKILDGGPYGLRVYIKNDDGTMILYAHLKSINNLNPNDKVVGGQLIGKMGKSGTDNVHLHLSFWLAGTSGRYVPGTARDAMNYIKEHYFPTNTMASNPFGSQYHHPSLSGHEGIDFSGNLNNLIQGWQNGLSGGFWGTNNFYKLLN